MATPDDVAQEAPPGGGGPDPEVPTDVAADDVVITTADVWNLHASPPTIEAAAEAWRGLRDQAETAWGLVHLAAKDVLGNEDWTGETADAYDRHQARAKGDVNDTHNAAVSVANHLDELAGVLRIGQALLDQERDGLRDIRAENDGNEIAFHAADQAQALRVGGAIAAAEEIRSYVDEELVVRTAKFATAGTILASVAENWRPLRHVNLNIGSGRDNDPREDKPGADYDEIPAVADLIADQNADVVTLQEVFEDDVPRIRERLEELTGDEWVPVYGGATSKPRWTEAAGSVNFPWPDPIGGVDEMDESFGNAVLVRQSDLVQGTTSLGTEELSEDTTLPDGTVISPDEGRATVGAQVELGDG